MENCRSVCVAALVWVCGLQPRAHLNCSMCPVKTWGPSVSDRPRCCKAPLHTPNSRVSAGHPIISMNILNTKTSVSFCLPVNQLLSGKFWILLVAPDSLVCINTCADSNPMGGTRTNSFQSGGWGGGFGKFHLLSASQVWSRSSQVTVWSARIHHSISLWLKELIVNGHRCS